MIHMDGFIEEDRKRSTDVSTVESQRNDLVPEEFPEGPYAAERPGLPLGKSSPWRKDQRPNNRFSYENRALHADLKRDYPGADDEFVLSTETEEEEQS